jgi:cation:H+ antiporter
VSSPVALLVFAVSLAVTLFAAAIVAERLDRLGHRLRWPEALIGLLTAVAADAPELSSAIAALATGAHSVGVGVVLGSNVFNIGSMIGVAALVAGSVRLRREALVFEGGVAAAVTLVVGALLLHLLPAWLALVLVGLVLVPYLVVLGAGAHGVVRLPISRRLSDALSRALGGTHHEPRGERRDDESMWSPLLLLVPALAAIVLGSIGMVRAAIVLGDRWDVPRVVVGTLVLAVLTSLPNAFTGIRLALHGRGAAVVSETLNSNTINLVGGLAIPALFVSLARVSGVSAFDLAYFVGLGVLALALLARRDGAGRRAGAVVAALYVLFVCLHVAFL